MKKIIGILTLCLLITSCGESKTQVEEAKQKMLEGTTIEVPQKIKDNLVEEKTEDEETQKVQIIPLSSEQFLSFDSIPQTDFTTKLGEIEITGTTLQNVDKIEVLFSNSTSKYPDDNYILQTYTSGDDSFTYRASSRNQVLDYGENTYIFKAYSGDEISQTKVVLAFTQETEEKTGTESQMIGTEDNSVLIDLPTSSKYGEPMKLGEASFTYTQIKGLEIEKEVLEAVTCETLTDFLTERMTSWYYWNTCRDIKKEQGIKFNVIRLDGEEYIYERHYIDFVHGLYGTYELEKGTGVSSETIAEKNKSLKEQEFPSLEIVDDLMKDIVNS